MYYYKIYDLTVSSSICFNFLEQVNPQNDNVNIDVEVIEINAGQAVIPHSDTININTARVFRDSVASFIIHNGKQIKFHRLNNKIHDETIARAMINAIFGYCLYQRRNFVLHASSIHYKKNNYLFIGSSGIGKSSMAASLSLSNNLDFVGEDVACLKVSSEGILQISGPPFVKLSDEIAQKLELNTFNKIALKSDRLNRSLYPMKTNTNYRNNVAGCFLLEWGEKFEIKKIESEFLLPNILFNTYSAFPFGSCKESSIRFHKNLETFLKHVPVYILRRNKNNFFENNVDIKNFIEKINSN